MLTYYSILVGLRILNENMETHRPASGRPSSFRNTNVLFLSWSKIAIFVGVLRYTLSTFNIQNKQWGSMFTSTKEDTNSRKDFCMKNITNF